MKVKISFIWKKNHGEKRKEEERVYGHIKARD